MRATLRDLAQKAGVSVSTVSRVLNDDGQVPLSASARARVMTALADMGLDLQDLAPTRRKRARGSAPGDIPEIGCLLNDLSQKYTHPYFSPLFQSMETQVNQQGMRVAFIETSENLLQNPRLFQKQATATRIEGIIIVTPDSQALLDQAVVLSPHVVVANAFGWGRFSHRRDFDQVGFDHEEASATAVNHLAGLGHRLIGFVGDIADDLRFSGYKRALAEAGLPFREDWVQECSFALTSGYEETRRLLSGHERPTAILAACDTIAIGALRALNEAGVRVPEEMSVIGIDDIEMAAFTAPPLTTVQVPKDEIGRWAVRLLADRLKGEKRPPVRVVVPVSLVVRGSTAPPKQG